MQPVLVAKWTTQEAEAARVQELLTELSAKSAAEPGCVLFEVYRSTTNPRVIFLHERYADADAAEAHRRSEHYQRIVGSQIIPRLAAREVHSVEQLS